MRKPYRHHRARVQTESHITALPLSSSALCHFSSGTGVRPYRTQNPSRWIDRPSRPSPSRLATKPAKRAQTYIAPVSSFLDNIKENIRQRHPFWLTSPISSIMVDVIRKGWRRYVTAFPPQRKARTLSLVKVARMSENEAAKAFKQIRWSATGGDPVCPRCGCLGVYGYKARPLFKCKACEHQFSVTSGTIFASRKLPLQTLLCRSPSS